MVAIYRDWLLGQRRCVDCRWYQPVVGVFRDQCKALPGDQTRPWVARSPDQERWRQIYPIEVMRDPEAWPRLKAKYGGFPDDYVPLTFPPPCGPEGKLWERR